MIFSKNRKSKTTQLYVFPKVPGKYALQKRRSFKVNALITGGDFDPASQRLYLTGYLPDYTQYIFKAEDFQLDSLDMIKLTRYPLLLKNAQVEGVCVHTDGRVWISSEGEDPNKPFLLPINFNQLKQSL